MKEEELETGGRTGVGSGIMLLAIGLFAVIAGLIAFDIAADYRSGTERSHILTEGAVMAFAVVGLGVLWRQFRLVQRRAEQLTVDLAAARREAQRFREEAHDALRGLGEAIDNQFTRWSLSPAEREVGLLLLKGLSHREIADVSLDDRDDHPPAGTCCLPQVRVAEPRGAICVLSGGLAATAKCCKYAAGCWKTEVCVTWNKRSSAFNPPIFPISAESRTVVWRAQTLRAHLSQSLSAIGRILPCRAVRWECVQ